MARGLLARRGSLFLLIVSFFFDSDSFLPISLGFAGFDPLAAGGLIALSLGARKGVVIELRRFFRASRRYCQAFI